MGDVTLYLKRSCYKAIFILSDEEWEVDADNVHLPKNGEPVCLVDHGSAHEEAKVL